MTNQIDRKCVECCFYRDPKDGATCGSCEYPVPEWVKIRSGGGFVSGYEAQTCATFKSMHELIRDVQKG